MGRNAILNEVHAERNRQEELKAAGKFLWTMDQHIKRIKSGVTREITDSEKLAVLAEEFGEVSAEVNEQIAVMDKGLMTRDQGAEYTARLRKELIQVAAVCVAWCEGIDAVSRSMADSAAEDAASKSNTGIAPSLQCREENAEGLTVKSIVSRLEQAIKADRNVQKAAKAAFRCSATDSTGKRCEKEVGHIDYHLISGEDGAATAWSDAQCNYCVAVIPDGRHSAAECSETRAKTKSNTGIAPAVDWHPADSITLWCRCGGCSECKPQRARLAYHSVDELLTLHEPCYRTVPLNGTCERCTMNAVWRMKHGIKVMVENTSCPIRAAHDYQASHCLKEAGHGGPHHVETPAGTLSWIIVNDPAIRMAIRNSWIQLTGQHT